MNNKITIREVAKAAGVSISSVHIALSGKPGVSEKTREHIESVAKKLGYQPNVLASGLKRRTQQIMVLLPDPIGDNSYYYPPIWQGIDDYLSSNMLNVACTKIAFSEETGDVLVPRVRKMIAEKGVDGILTAGHMDIISPNDWKMIQKNNIAVAFVNSDRPEYPRLCCVEPDFGVIGRTMAELIFSHIEPYGSVFLCAGNPKWNAHAKIVQGFDSYMQENHISNLVYKDYSWTMDSTNYSHILREIMRPDVAACGSVYAQGTVLLGRALEESGKMQLYAVGSDLSDETSDRLRRSVLNNVIQKNPYAQGYLAMKVLTDYLAGGIEPEQSVIYVGSEVVFKSNLSMYENAGYRVMIT